MHNLWWILLVIVAANGAPILIHIWVEPRINYPVDFNFKFFDGNRLFGNSKTWIGVASIILVATGLSWSFGLGWQTGLLAGLGVASGDLLSSFIKRRLGMRSSSMALGLDQIPESLFPFFLLMNRFNLSMIDILLGVLCFTILELIISRILYRWHIKEKPY